jgi:uncharacterized protein (TIGR00369 family)
MPFESAKSEKNPVRERIVRWDDPASMADVGRKMSGRDYLEAICAGRLPPPPVANLVGFTMDEVGDGTATMSMAPHESQYNPIGCVHGGIVATLLDSVMGCAVHSKVPAGRGYTTLEIKVNYLRAVTSRVPLLRGQGRVIHFGRQTAMAEGSIVDEAGRLYAQGTTTCLIFDLPPG